MMQGLGDAVYQRPFVRAQGRVRETYIDTVWPEVYADLPGVFPVRPRTIYRTQAKNLARLSAFPWAEEPADFERGRFTYMLQRPTGSICDELEHHVGLAGQPFVFDAPDFGPPPVDAPYAVIRPVSVRTEWSNPARNPDPAYVAEAARILRAAGFRVVCVADLAPGAETLVGEMPEADVYLTRGELAQPDLFALIRHAAVVVGGVGWIVPVALAYGTPAVIIGGGLGQFNRPDRLVDPRIDGSAMRFILPTPYCMCRIPRHQCPRVIPVFAEKFQAALLEVAAPAQAVAA